jgi:parallel beta-helix repeat protein
MRTYLPKIKVALLFLFSFNSGIATIPSAQASATYYVSSSTGDDANDGLSPEGAWQHLSKIYLKSISRPPFQPGDKILLKRDDQWEGQIRLEAHGTSQQPIIIGAYGHGLKPVLYGVGAYASWEPVAGHAGFYTFDMGAGSILGAVVQNGIILKTIYRRGSLKQQGTSAILAHLQPGAIAGQSGNRLWVRMSDLHSPQKTVRVFRLAGVSLANASYIQVENLDIQRFYTGIDVENSQQVTIRHDDVQDVLGIGIYLRSNDRNCFVESNTVFHSGNTALYVLKGSRNTFRDNWVSDVERTVLGVRVGGDAMGIGLQESQRSLVEYNYFTYSGGIDFYYEKNSIVRYNYLSRVRSAGSPHGEDLEVYGNIYNLGGTVEQHGSRGINAVATGPGIISIFNNTIFNASDYFMMGTGLNGGRVEFSHNIAASTTGGSVITAFGAQVSSDHNCFFAPGDVLFRYAKEQFSSLASYQKIGLEQHSVFGDPQFLKVPPSTPVDFRIPVSSPCNSRASGAPSTAPAGHSYDHGQYLPTGPVMGALRPGQTTGSQLSSRQVCTSHCWGRNFAVSNGTYLLTVRFAPRRSRRGEMNLIVDGIRVTAEFKGSQPSDGEGKLLRSFLVRSANGHIVLRPDSGTNVPIVSEVKIFPFDASHGDGPQVIPW